jgi:drug/metabolite transporter (DMT)-like permease
LITGYSGKLQLHDFFIPGISLVVMNCAGAATATVIVRAKVGNLPPETLSLNRTFWLLLFSTVWMFAEGQSFTIPRTALTNTFIAAMLEPVLAILLVYKAYQYIEASRGTIIQSLKGLIIIPVAYIYFGTLPYNYQIAGGIIATIGVVILALGQHAINYVQRTNNRK